MNGKEGGHPYTDIVVHHIEVFGEGIDDLVRELDAIGGFESEIAGTGFGFKLTTCKKRRTRREREASGTGSSGISTTRSIAYIARRDGISTTRPIG